LRGDAGRYNEDKGRHNPKILSYSKTINFRNRKFDKCSDQRE
jgi:hypothetical protein